MGFNLVCILCFSVQMSIESCVYALREYMQVLLKKIDNVNRLYFKIVVFFFLIDRLAPVYQNWNIEEISYSSCLLIYKIFDSVQLLSSIIMRSCQNFWDEELCLFTLCIIVVIYLFIAVMFTLYKTPWGYSRQRVVVRGSLCGQERRIIVNPRF